MARRLTLILGGARSGKSKYAGKLASALGEAVLYVATAEAKDEEMSARIAQHRLERPEHWNTLEVPQNVGALISDHAREADVVLLDCLTLLVSNVLLELPETGELETALAAVDAEIDALLRTYDRSEAEWIVVSNEVGLGVVPPNRLGRAFRDTLGHVNQRLAERADVVLFMVAGLPMRLNG